MRKIITKEGKERKETRNKLIVGLILVGILILSTAGYAFFGGEKTEVKKLEYKGIEFLLQEDGLWHFKISNQEFYTVYNPKETENFSVSLNLNLQNYAGKPLYFSYDSNYEGTREIVRNIGRFNTRIQKACLDECEEDFPIKNCTDNVIIIKEINESLIKQEENCVYVLAKQEDIVRATDAFIFHILEI